MQPAGIGRDFELRENKKLKNDKQSRHFDDMLDDSRFECYDVLRKHDKDMIDGWNAEIDTLLVFVSDNNACAVSLDTADSPCLVGWPFLRCRYSIQCPVIPFARTDITRSVN